MLAYSSSHLTLLLFFFTYLLHILLFLPTSLSDLSSDRAALLTLRSAVGGRTLFWNTTQTTPCLWPGIQCDNNRVTSLRLPGASLSGYLPSGTFGNLTALRTLSLRLNSLSGPLPSDLGSCTELRNLYLQGNHFSGDIPDSLFTLHRLVRLNLAGNNLTGEIPSGFNNLTHLRTLYLENNRFSGSLPELNLRNITQFNVSFNRLNGSVPKGLQSIPASAFLGNVLCGKPLDSCSGSDASAAAVGGLGAGNVVVNSSNSKKKNGLYGGAVAGIVMGSVLGFLFLVLLLFVCCRKTNSKRARSVDVAAFKHQEMDILGEKDTMEAENSDLSNGYSVAAAAAATSAMTAAGKGESGNDSGAKRLVFFGNREGMFDLEDLLRASAEVLGKGTFGTAYKAVLEVGMVVAVKRLKDVSISEKEFREKIESVGGMDHENLVPLRAYYYSREEKLLVYDYMPMGSLSALLHGNKGAGRNPLNWEVRSAIALNAARGIEYLHSRGPNVSHGNIKSSNILLTGKPHEARVTDFGLGHLVGPSSTPNRVAGYRAPEVTDSRKVSQKADVYSFGVLLLELLTGKAPTHTLLNEEGVDLPRWVQSVVREEWNSEVFDVEMVRYQNVVEEMVQLLQLAMDCAAQYPDKRPSMSDVRRRIEELCSSFVSGDGC